MLWAFVLVLALSYANANAKYVSPVFLWGVNSQSKSSLQTVSQEGFAEILKPLLKSHMVVAFQEENLSSRDFLCQKDSSASCYARMSGFSPKAYYASVENPTEAVRSLTKDREYNFVDSNGKLQAPLECSPGKVAFISFDDVTENSRADVLEAHDAAMDEISKEFDNCRVIYLYMSTPNNNVKSRVRRDTAPNGGFVFREKNQFLIYWKDLLYKNGSDNTYAPITINSMSITNQSGTEFVVSLLDASGKTLKFNVKLGSDGYYTMSQIKFGDSSFYSKLLNAPKSFSYHCGNLTLNTLSGGQGKNAYLKWNSLQFQAPFNAKTADDFVFGDAWDCVPFFTPGILSGLFVVILLLAITFTGICWMIDINTMDRFDDPKGKTITINASE